jgi:isopenicillin N synthase-like dioxygenase
MAPVIPVIDLNRSFTDEKVRRAVAKEIGKACETVGFFMVSGHGVPRSLIDEFDGVSRAFFDLPREEKMKLSMRVNGNRRGYRFVGESNLVGLDGDEKPHDLRETFVTGPTAIAGDPYYERPEARGYFEPNVWPERPKGFREAQAAYHAALTGVATNLMQLCALALGLPEHFFQDKFDRQITNINLVNYPAQPTPPKPGQLRAGAHADFGTLTLLATDGSPGGLQVQLDDAWHDVMPIREAFIVNLGDLMAQWTNDRWRSTIHRVVNPPETASTSRRHSIVFFHQPNFDAVIECLPTCLKPGEQPKYAPVTSGEHLMAQIAKVFGSKKVEPVPA